MVPRDLLILPFIFSVLVLNADPAAKALPDRSNLIEKMGEVSTGDGPKSLMFTPDGRFLVTALLFGSGIEVYSVEPLSLAEKIVLDDIVTGFVELVFNQSRNEIWVSQMLTHSIHILDGDTYQPLRVIPSGGEWPKVLAFSSDENTAYASHWITKDVSFIDVHSGDLTALVPIPGIPRGLAVSKNSRELYAANFTTGALEIINREQKLITDTVETGPGAMRHVVLDSAGVAAFASDMYTGRITAIDLRDRSFRKSGRLASNPNTIVLSSDDRYLFVSCRGRNNDVDYRMKSPERGKIFILDTRTLEIVDWIWGGNQPTGLALSPDNSMMVFSNFFDNTIELHDISGLWSSLTSR
ncbi:MAG: hypothetical protein HN368_07800 [Spirochaetales bacterium]|jgi:DNA-binding beta-propeller fold protein YncE|nr:hypothetical protein [Spirochaetales bacterium]